MKKYDISILLAGVCWGVIGLFSRSLMALGLTTRGILIVRSGGCAVLFLASALVRGGSALKIRLKDIPLTVGLGLATFFFTFCYYLSIERGSLSAACVLMYSAPVFVMIFSLFLFREKFTRRKLLALLCAMAGCVLVSGVLEGSSTGSMAGTLFGLLAGIGYATYSVCIKALSLRGVGTLTMNIYGWTVCTLLGLVIFGPAQAAPAFQSGTSWLLAIGLCVIPGFLPALLYSYGLSGTEAGKGAVMATTEPVVASLAGLVYHEIPSVPGVIGIILVLGAVVLLNINLPAKKKE